MRLVRTFRAAAGCFGSDRGWLLFVNSLRAGNYARVCQSVAGGCIFDIGSALEESKCGVEMIRGIHEYDVGKR